MSLNPIVFALRHPITVMVAIAALVVGSEAHGTSSDAHNRATMRVHVPMRSGVESLNASVAASIVIYSALGPRVSGP